jgi:hypothetical protein
MGNSFTFFDALPLAASSPLALLGYLAALAASVALVWRVRRNRNLLDRIKDIPRGDRKDALQAEMGVVLPKSISAEQWLRSRLHHFYFLGFVIVVLCLTLIGVIAFTYSGKLGSSAREGNAARDAQGNSQMPAVADAPVDPRRSVRTGFQNGSPAVANSRAATSHGSTPAPQPGPSPARSVNPEEPVCHSGRYIAECTITPNRSGSYTATAIGRWLGTNGTATMYVKVYPGNDPTNEGLATTCGTWDTNWENNENNLSKICSVFLRHGQPVIFRLTEINHGATTIGVSLNLLRE